MNKFNCQRAIPKFIIVFICAIIICGSLIILISENKKEIVPEYKIDKQLNSTILIVYTENCLYCDILIKDLFKGYYYYLLKDMNIDVFKVHEKEYEKIFKERIRAFPETIYFKDGKIQSRYIGYKESLKGIEKIIKENGVKHPLQ